MRFVGLLYRLSAAEERTKESPEYRTFLLRTALFLIALLCVAVPGQAESAPSPSYHGWTIRNVLVEVGPIFERPDRLLYSTANALKIPTRDHVVRQELLFKSGDRYDDFILRESERRLRSLRYLRKVSISPRPVSDTEVDVVVQVQDTWTLIPQISYSSGASGTNRSAGLAESDFLGLGQRVEASYAQKEEREILQGLFEDQRILGSSNRFLGAYFDRSDGHQLVSYFGQPLRSLVDKRGWYFNIDDSSKVGRLFENGTENYIFREDKTEISTRYTISRGDPEIRLRRYSLGWDITRANFSQATSEDYDDLNLDPEEVSNDPFRLPRDRRFNGPVLSYEYIKPDFISKNYIDRFDRVEDYNLGPEHDLSVMFAPEALGAIEDTILFNGDKSGGLRFCPDTFLRYEAGIASRLERGSFVNTLYRGELKYFDILGDWFIGDQFLGRHTLASTLYADYGTHLDRDRQFLVGGDNALRGYEQRAFSGDKRMVFNFEDRVHFIDDLFQLISLGGAAFVDVGGATYDPFETIFSEHLYADVGVGLRIGFPRSSGGQVARIDLAFPLRDGPEEEGTDAFQVRFSFAGGQLFGARLRSEELGPERANVAVGLEQ